jgi:hypothetical protein
MIVRTGSNVGRHLIRSDVGIGSRSHWVGLELRMILETSISLAGAKSDRKVVIIGGAE